MRGITEENRTHFTMRDVLLATLAIAGMLGFVRFMDFVDRWEAKHPRPHVIEPVKHYAASRLR